MYKIGDKFKDEHGRELELVEINELGEYVLSYYDYNQWNVSVYSQDELDMLDNL